MAIFNSVFTGGFSSNVSSNALRNSPKNYSFPKCERFQEPYNMNKAEFLNFPTIVTNKCSTIGHGERGQFLKKLPGYEVPPPTNYNYVSEFIRKDPLKGKTFGLGYKYYDNVLVPGAKMLTPKNLAEIPGPGHYNTERGHSFGENATQATIKSRIPINYFATKEFPAPNMYKPNYATVEQGRYNSISFGVGKRQTTQTSSGKYLFS